MAEREQRHGGDLYTVLGLTPEASSQQIRSAYQQLAGEIVAGQASAVQRQAIEEAFETLGDPIKRLRYDAQSAAPPPPRFQMPSIRLSGRRPSIQLPRIPAIKRPDLPHVDPMLAAAVAIVVIVGLAVLLLPLLHGRPQPTPPAQSVADLVGSPTAAASASPSATAGAQRAPAGGLIPGAPGGAPGSLIPGASSGQPGSLVPLPPSALPPGLFGPPPGAAGGEPPFLTVSAIIDMLRAVAAATAVRNGPPPAAAGPPPGNPLSGLLQPNPPPAGIPITSLGAVPPLVGGAQPALPLPALAAAPATPPPAAPTATAAPNHIAVPAGPLSALGAPPTAGRPASVATTPPNRFVPQPAGSH